MTQLRPSTCFATVVTEGLIDEFLILRASIELWHGLVQWSVRCDEPTATRLRSLDNVSLTVAIAAAPTPIHQSDARFGSIVRHKMGAIDDAWSCRGIERVIFCDADLCAVASFVDDLPLADVVLSPNFYPNQDKQLAAIHGYFNSGFLALCDRTFHHRWVAAFESQPWLFTDQACLNDLAREYAVSLLDERSNIGFWRSPAWRVFTFEPLPLDATFVHCHFYRDLRKRHGWVDRCFGLHVVRFLYDSADAKRRELADIILQHDASGWYRASLALTEPAKNAHR